MPTHRLLGSLLLALFTIGCSTAPTSQIGRLRHVVMFAFKAEATQQQITSVEQSAAELQHQIPEILDFEWGTDVSSENRTQGFTHCILVTFADAAARDVYLPHAAHQAFVKTAVPLFEKVLVIDYIAKN